MKLFQTGIATRIIDVLLLWVGKVPGSLSIIAIGTSTVFAAMSGSSSSAATILSTSLMPEMYKRGYKTPMAVGPIVGSSGLAQIIPPSALAIIVASVAHISIGKLFMAGYLPGLLEATFYVAYILIRCKLQPQIAPVFDIPKYPLSYKIKHTAINAVPILIIIFSVMGVIFLGIATPAESAAIGSLASILLAIAYRKMSWNLLKKTLFSLPESERNGLDHHTWSRYVQPHTCVFGSYPVPDIFNYQRECISFGCPDPDGGH